MWGRSIERKPASAFGTIKGPYIIHLHLCSRQRSHDCSYTSSKSTYIVQDGSFRLVYIASPTPHYYHRARCTNCQLKHSHYLSLQRRYAHWTCVATVPAASVLWTSYRAIPALFGPVALNTTNTFIVYYSAQIQHNGTDNVIFHNPCEYVISEFQIRKFSYTSMLA